MFYCKLKYLFNLGVKANQDLALNVGMSVISALMQQWRLRLCSVMI
uniref:Uncharacterized protein n=1 Tax=Manihot esculenta TaxID=3983 RepID=A0A2C9U486_MANES